MPLEKKDVDQNTILVEWQTCVQMADSVSRRRDTTNQLFVTLNLALLAAFPWSHGSKSFLIIALGIILCILWWLFIRNYKRLNEAKFSVICNLEKSLPVAPFYDEWRNIQYNANYKEGTTLERFLPVIFGILYLFVAAMIYYGWFA